MKLFNKIIFVALFSAFCFNSCVEDMPVPPSEPTDEPISYTGLVINEIDGNGKFIELYNSSDKEISLKGVEIIKNETGSWWTGGDVKIAAKGRYTIAQTGQTIAGSNEQTGTSGISPKKTIKFELIIGETLIDSFSRVKADGALDANCTPDYGSEPKYSFSRCPDGTGSFGLAVPSCGAANPATAAGTIVTN
ncbi:MAG: lamin tail domain-containing protein [Dysgonamonadaceae bacterium]|jgi:hypothetical protein|nr:lamin tail domain-containing protein [Dysgonamonadaceae bacterium]